MSTEEKKYTEVVPDEMKEPKYANTYKLSYSESEIYLDFGHITQVSENENETVKVVSRVFFSPSLLKRLMLGLYEAGIDYEREFGYNIGMNDDEDYQDDEEVEE